MKAFVITTFCLVTGLVTFAAGGNPHLPLSLVPAHNGHTPWYVFAGIVFAALVLSALTIANAEPKK